MVESMHEIGPHWILGVRIRGEYLIQKNYHPHIGSRCMDHIKVEKDSDWVLWVSLSKNATKPCLPPRICVEPDVDHDTTYTWHCISTEYHGPIIRCAKSVQWNWLICHPLCEHGKSPSCGCKGKSYINGAHSGKPQGNLKWVLANRAMNSSIVDVLHIRKAIIPLTWMFIVMHCQYVHDHLIDHFYLSIDLGMEGSGFGELGVQQWP